jgi:Flp pilus assembly protein TadD
MWEKKLEWYLGFNRDWAEALLIHEEKKFILLSEKERRVLQKRAQGILPTEEEEIIKEILSIPLLLPREFLQSPASFRERAEMLLGFSPYAPLAFLLSLFSAENEEEMIELGKLFHRVREVIGEEKEPILQTSPSGKVSEEFERRFRFLALLRDKFLRHRPKIKDFPLTLKESLEIYASYGRKRELNHFFLSLIEWYLLRSFGFEANLYQTESGMNILLLIDKKPVFWETSSPSPLSFTLPPDGEVLDDFRFLLYLVYFQREKDQRRRRENLLFLYQLLSEKKPSDSLFAYEIAKLFFLENDYRQAEDFALEALHLAPEREEKRAESYCLLGNIYAYREDWKRALASYQSALILKPNSPEIHSNLGAVYMKMGEREKARLAYKTALQISPKNLSALYNLGVLCLAEGDYKNSIHYLEEATKIDGKNPSLFYTLACVYYEKGDLLKAEVNFRKVLEFDNKNAFAWYNLGIVYRDRGEKEKAVQALEKAASLNPNLLK